MVALDQLEADVRSALASSKDDSPWRLPLEGLLNIAQRDVSVARLNDKSLASTIQSATENTQRLRVEVADINQHGDARQVERMERWSLRLAEDLGGLEPQPTLPQVPGNAAMAQSVDRPEDTIKELAGSYGEESAAQRRTSIWLGSFALAAAALGFSLAVFYLPSRLAASSNAWARATYMIALLLPLGVSVALFRRAGVAERYARECMRLSRGLSGVDSYLAPLPSAARALLRGAYLQTLFPRLLDDDDPLRQTPWPESHDLLDAVYRGLEFDSPPPEPESSGVLDAGASVAKIPAPGER
jgi:hypothetical protein